MLNVPRDLMGGSEIKTKMLTSSNQKYVCLCTSIANHNYSNATNFVKEQKKHIFKEMWAKMRRRWAMGVFSKWILLEWNIPWGLKMLLCVMSCVISRKQHIDFVPTLSVIFITKLQVDITVFRFWRLENISVRILEVYIVDSSLDRKEHL